MLSLAPWTLFWERNYFAHTLAWLGAWMANPYVRGAVTGVGIVTLVAGFRDLSGIILARGRAADDPPIAP